MQDYFVPENLILASRVEHPSPSGRYTFMTMNYRTQRGESDVTRGVVQRGDDCIAEIKVMQSDMPFAWAEDHTDGHDYLVAVHAPQGHCVIRLDTGERANAMHDGSTDGNGLSWAEIIPSPDKTRLAIVECAGKGPYRVAVYDFREPLGSCPEVARSRAPECFGWDGDGLRVGWIADTVRSTGERVADLTVDRFLAIEGERTAAKASPQDVYDHRHIESRLSVPCFPGGAHHV